MNRCVTGIILVRKFVKIWVGKLGRKNEGKISSRAKPDFFKEKSLNSRREAVRYTVGTCPEGRGIRIAEQQRSKGF